jgi:hypothetical protein
MHNAAGVKKFLMRGWAAKKSGGWGRRTPDSGTCFAN